MGSEDRRAGVFYDKLGDWKAEMEAVRAVLLAGPLEETFKWRQPCYVWNGTNVCMPGGYGGRCRLSFFRGVLLDDPEGLLVPPGPNSRAARVMEFHSVEEVEAARGAIEGFVAQAVKLVEEGRTVDLPADDFELVEELEEALAGDDALREAWEALTPGRRRGWALHFGGAKKAETRVGRIEKARDAILDGKGMHDR
ncbi:YdeI/OmpD-associated family protein [Vannielia sp. SX4]|uniref:YdeI/OmpD-associated family protein n=1 Tax=Vannielia sp. SX4 TaxID=3463852 RepID=UPI0040581F9A